MHVDRVKRALDRTQALAEEIKREQATPLAIPFSIRRPSPKDLLIDIGGCETLARCFNTNPDMNKTRSRTRHRVPYSDPESSMVESANLILLASH
jgi:hypothetical protein